MRKIGYRRIAESRSQQYVPIVPRLAVTLVALLVCLFAIVTAATAGFSRYLAQEALAYKDLRSANDAVKLAPNDPEGYHSRGVLLLASHNFDEAVEDLQKSARLQPDSKTWLDLGRAYQAKGDLAKAAEALAEAVRLAPYYAEPRWYLGNSLLSLGSREDAMRQLKLAAKSDPTLLPRVIDLAWKAYEGSPPEVLQALEPQNDSERVTLASFFIEQNQMKEALNLLRSSSRNADYDRHGISIRLIEKNRFRDAADVLNSGVDSVREGEINDADFEPGSMPAPGFGWKFMRQPGNTRISIDKEKASSGIRSLSLVFNGLASWEAEFVTQLVLVAPRTRYKLAFSSSSEDLETESPPRIAVVEANPGGHLLAESKPAELGTAGWSSRQVDFETTGLTQAVYVAVRLQKCQTDTCLVFGKVWFDNFSLTKF